MALPIAEGGGVAVFACEEMLVDAEKARVLAADPFPGLQAQIPEKPALDGGAGNPFLPPQRAAADAVEVFLTDAAPEPLTGPQTRQNIGKPLPEIALTAQTAPLARFHLPLGLPLAPRLMPRPAHPPVLQPQLLLPALRTRNPARVTHPDADPPGDLFDACNLIFGQARYCL
jgi:hypothetical protein